MHVCGWPGFDALCQRALPAQCQGAPEHHRVWPQNKSKRQHPYTCISLEPALELEKQEILGAYPVNPDTSQDPSHPAKGGPRAESGERAQHCWVRPQNKKNHCNPQILIGNFFWQTFIKQNNVAYLVFSLVKTHSYLYTRFNVSLEEQKKQSRLCKMLRMDRAEQGLQLHKADDILFSKRYQNINAKRLCSWLHPFTTVTPQTNRLGLTG